MSNPIYYVEVVLREYRYEANPGGTTGFTTETVLAATRRRFDRRTEAITGHAVAVEALQTDAQD